MTAYHFLSVHCAVDDILNRGIKFLGIADLNNPFELLSVERLDRVWLQGQEKRYHRKGEDIQLRGLVTINAFIEIENREIGFEVSYFRDVNVE